MFPNPDTLDTYINSGSPLNIIDKTLDDTLLMYACTQILNSRNNQEWSNVVMKILEHTPEEINLGYANVYGITALILVSGVDNDVSLKMLDYGPEAVNINAVEKNNEMNALMYSCTNDTEEVAIQMLEIPTIVISIKHINKNGYTPLMLACEENLEEVALTMINKFTVDDLHLFQKNNSDKNAFDIALENNLVDVYIILGQLMIEYERNTNMYSNNNDNDNNENTTYEWGKSEMPIIPTYPEQIINTSKNGYDSIMLEERNIKEYMDEDKDNIVILYEEKYYLSSRSTIETQLEDGIVFECLLAGGDKKPSNIVQNLPLFNLKMIGIDIPTDKIGIWPEFIYLDGIKNILMSENQYFSVIPLLDKMLISVISLNEAKKWGTGQGSAAGSLHCQNGQGGMAGIIVLANPTVIGGKKRKTMRRKRSKRKKTLKKIFKRKSNK
jgi:ankyrin repeat protein